MRKITYVILMLVVCLLVFAFSACAVAPEIDGIGDYSENNVEEDSVNLVGEIGMAGVYTYDDAYVHCVVYGSDIECISKIAP